VADPTLAVLAPSVYVSVTIEPDADADDIHIHAGGQGIWVARMLRLLEAKPVVCAPVGGETGRALVGLTRDWRIDLQRVETIADTPAYVHDRRGGDRVEVARSRTAALRRHEVDQLYNRFLELALAAGRCVVTGPVTEDLVPIDVYRRLGSDLDAAGIPVVADLHGVSLTGMLEGGPIALLKVSAGDLVEDGLLADDAREDDAAVAAVSDQLVQDGVERVVVSRGGAPILATFPEGRFCATGPALETVDTQGSGDSMTAALTLALATGTEPRVMLARAWAAGAANVTRRGLGSAAPGLIDELTDLAVVEELDV
jgi:1-phosphofructokinase